MIVQSLVNQEWASYRTHRELVRCYWAQGAEDSIDLVALYRNAVSLYYHTSFHIVAYQCCLLEIKNIAFWWLNLNRFSDLHND
jgi:hypothetical protein